MFHNILDLNKKNISVSAPILSKEPETLYVCGAREYDELRHLTGAPARPQKVHGWYR